MARESAGVHSRAVPLPFLRDIGGYSLREELGRGSSGAVYKAVDGRTGREVALKLFARASDGHTAVERFQQEARALARVGAHPHLVSVHAAGEHAGLPWFVMDLVRGRPLEELLEAGPLAWTAAV